MNRILNAQPGETIVINTHKWISFHRMVLEALDLRRDVTLVVNYLDEGYKGNEQSFTIPADSKKNKIKPSDCLKGEDFAGFLYLNGLYPNK